MENKDISNDLKEKQAQLTVIDELNASQLAFFVHLRRGISIPEAYHKAGYEGNDASAYQLKSRLNDQYKRFLDETSMNEADWMAKVNSLLDKPLLRYDKFGNVYEVQGLTVDQYLKTLALEQKRIETKQVKKSNVTAFQINRYTNDKKQETTEVKIDGKTIDVALDDNASGQTPS